MNDKENSEIRRHTKPDKSNMTAIYGCFVNQDKKIISNFRLSTGMLSEMEGEKYFSFLKKNLSGAVGKNLIELEAADLSDEYQLLLALRDSQLEDEALLQQFYEKVIDVVHLEDNFLILMGCDTYDVPFKNKNDELDEDRGTETYRYLLCGICPVKETKPALSYDNRDRMFHENGVSQIMGAPVVGFLFPTFTGRTTNIRNVQLYTRDPGDNHGELVDALFKATPVMAAKEQKRSFEALLTNSLEDECSMDVVQAVHSELAQLIQIHKESKVEDPLLIGREQVAAVLNANGVSENALAKFRVDYDEAFGFGTELHPRNVIDQKHFEVKTPDVTIHVNPECSHLVETRVINGVKYILIAADDNVEVNGVSINIDSE